MTTAQIRSLLEEREGYRRLGDLDRVAEVDAVLASVGYVDDEPETIEPEPEPEQESTAVEPAPEQAVPPRPTRRRRTSG